MSCPSTNDWDLLAMETLDEQAAAPLLARYMEELGHQLLSMR